MIGEEADTTTGIAGNIFGQDRKGQQSTLENNVIATEERRDRSERRPVAFLAGAGSTRRSSPTMTSVAPTEVRYKPLAAPRSVIPSSCATMDSSVPSSTSKRRIAGFDQGPARRSTIWS